jgi:hypothetical protein
MLSSRWIGTRGRTRPQFDLQILMRPPSNFSYSDRLSGLSRKSINNNQLSSDQKETR